MRIWQWFYERVYWVLARKVETHACPDCGHAAIAVWRFRKERASIRAMYWVLTHDCDEIEMIAELVRLENADTVWFDSGENDQQN